MAWKQIPRTPPSSPMGAPIVHAILLALSIAGTLGALAVGSPGWLPSSVLAVTIVFYFVWDWYQSGRSLLAAATAGRAEIVARIVRTEPDSVKSRDSEGRSGLHIVASFGDLDIAEILVSSGAPLDAEDNHGFRPLHYAASKGRTPMIGLLAEGGCDVNAASESGYTPLHLSAAFGHSDSAKSLLAHGARPSARDGRGRTAADLARRHGRRAVMRVLEHWPDA